MEGKLLFRLLTPLKEVCSCRCDSVVLFEKENARGQGGGSLGIHPGHLPAVIALEDNRPLKVFSQGNAVFEALVHGGFARVDSGSVTVLTSSAEVD